MDMNMLVERTQGWRAGVKGPRPWQALLVLGLLLLAADIIGQTTFIMNVAGAMNGRPVGGVQDLLFAASITLTITAGQIGFWAFYTRRVEPFANRYIFAAFNALGGALNVLGIFLPLAIGRPAVENLWATIERVSASPLHLLFISIHLMLATIVALVPEYLFILSLNLRDARAAVGGERETAEG